MRASLQPILRPGLAAARVAAAAALLTGCASIAVTSSVEQQPMGPSPAVTVVVRVGDAGESSVDLTGLGADPVELEAATTAIANLIVDPAAVGTVVPAASSVAAAAQNGQDPVISTSVPITVSDQAFTIDLHSDEIAVALAGVRPRSTDVWVCTTSARTVQVSSQAPGAVPSDVASDTCQSAGSSLVRDGVVWTAQAAIGPVTEPSKLPWIAWILVATAVGVGVVLYLRRRRRERSDPILPPVH
jgi:hypothetical protein